MSDAHTDGRPATAVPRATDFAVLFERSPDPMVAVDDVDATSVVLANAAYRRTFGETAGGDAAARAGIDLSGPERSVVRTAASGSVGRDAVTRRTPRGRRTFALEAVPASETGVTAFVRYRDVTARRVRDQQLAVLRRVLRHDLRNDLTVVLGYARSIAEATEAPRTREAAEAVVEATADLRGIAASAGRLETVTDAPGPSTIGDSLARVRREVAATVPGEVEIDAPTPAASVDGRIAVALEELCRTLVDRGAATSVRLRSDVDGPDVHVVVESDATLPDQQCAALEGRRETQLRHATGLSAWIARWAVRAAGGTLRPGTTDDGGTRITLTVPRLDGDAEQPRRPDVRTGTD